MMQLPSLARGIVCLATFGMLLPHTLVAAQTGQPSPALQPTISQPAVVAPISDVRLHEGGTLLGQVVDAQGIAAANKPVAVHAHNRVVGSAVTDKHGHFVVSGLQGGVYQVVAGSDGTGAYRLWVNKTAPPVAKPAALIVCGDQVVRGQCYPSLVRFLTNPWVVAGLIGTAIAVPIALNNHDSESGS